LGRARSTAAAWPLAARADDPQAPARVGAFAQGLAEFFCLLGLVLTAAMILVIAPGAVTWALALIE
jgi:hypothetical protein